jgi:hypothetical protein
VKTLLKYKTEKYYDEIETKKGTKIGAFKAVEDLKCGCICFYVS